MKICLDAGHYGKYNRSPVNPAYYESDMAWKLQGYLKSALESYGFTVIVTRTSQDKDLALEARGKMSKGCVLFLSLHSNACEDAAVNYPLACCCVSGKADVLGQKLAETVQTVMNIRQNGKIWKRQGTSGDYYGVLRGAASVDTPGILLEHSFHTNAAAANWLLQDANLKKMAQAEADTIAAYYHVKENASTGPAASENKTAPKGSYLVKITCDALNIRKGPGTGYAVVGCIRDRGVYTIIEEKDGWGRLKSGAGWICLNYTAK